MLDKLRRLVRGEQMQAVTLSEGLQIVIAMKQRGANTPQWFSTGVASLIEYLGEDRLVEAVTADDIAGWYLWLVGQDNKHRPGRKLSLHTTDSYARSVKAYFNHLVTVRHISASPFRISLPKPPKKDKKDIEIDDIERMIQTARTLRDQALILALRDAGCRLNALISMTTDNTTLYEVEGRWEGRAFVFDEKIDEWLWIFFQERAAQALHRYQYTRPAHLPHNAFWLTSDSKPLKRAGAYQIFKRIGERAGVNHYNPHAFRHAKVKRMLLAGAPHKAIQDALAWKSDAMIQQYIQSTPEDVRQYNRNYDRLDDLDSV